MSRQRSDEAIAAATLVSIGELARLSGVRYSTIKFYTNEGMVPYAQEDSYRTRRYHRVEALARLAQLQALRQRGLTIPQLKEMFAP